MLISVHLPKTAGRSFGASLEAYYGKRILRDYADRPINTSILKRHSNALMKCVLNGFRDHKKIECIHGHFLPIKYLLFGTFNKNVKFITWMRHPAERLVSHYYHWIRSYNPKNAPPLHRRVVEEKWTLERFCLGKELQNIYTQFFWGFPFERFEFIGITEYYESEIQYFSKEFLGNSLKVFTRNVNPEKGKDSYFIEQPALLEKIEKHHSKDMLLYRKAVDMRLSMRAADAGYAEALQPGFTSEAIPASKGNNT